MLETIRQFAEEQLVVAVKLTRSVPRTPATSPSEKPKSLDALGQPSTAGVRAWFTAELANLRTAFRWAADNDHLTEAAAIAIYGTVLGMWAASTSRWLGRGVHRARPGRRPSRPWSYTNGVALLRQVGNRGGSSVT